MNQGAKNYLYGDIFGDLQFSIKYSTVSVLLKECIIQLYIITSPTVFPIAFFHTVREAG